ncbi:CL032 protein-like [Scleropages formosus]|uniref:CL032 protein-like n=1 Tax=Scleropages formosus TaxID=113540 RepID=A0A0P7W6X2_SCLFO|nr:CL032 protein-like [Scleropages formosus]
MPRTTRKGPPLNPRKAPLLFVEAPLNGAKHHYVPEGPRSVNPKPVTSEQQQRESRSSSTTWVTPQFDDTMQLQVPACRRGRGKSSRSGRSVLDRSSPLILPHLKKTSVCKFPALTFESSTSSPTRCPVPTRRFKDPRPAAGAPEYKRVPGCAQNAVSPSIQSGGDTETPKRFNRFWSGYKRDRGAHGVPSPEKTSCTVVPGEQSVLLTVAGAANVCPIRTVTPLAPRGDHSDGMDSVFSPPNIGTPETQRNPISTKPSPSFRLQPPLTQTQLTPENQTSNILANDTPEEDYGLKVTWRRRKRLMKLLIEQGQLSCADITINF